MRVLFYTAAFVAASMANLAQAVRIDSQEVAQTYEDNFSQLYAFDDKKPSPAPAAETQQERKKR